MAVIKAFLMDYGKENAGLDLDIDGRSNELADLIVLILREVERGRTGWNRSTTSMMRRIRTQLKTLEDFSQENTLAEDFATLNGIRAFDLEKMRALEKKFAESETGSEMTVKTEGGSEMTVKQDGKIIEIKMTTKED